MGIKKKIIKAVVLWWFRVWVAFPNGFWAVMAGLAITAWWRAFSIPFAVVVIPTFYIVICLLTIVGGMFIKDIRKW